MHPPTHPTKPTRGFTQLLELTELSDAPKVHPPTAPMRTHPLCTHTPYPRTNLSVHSATQMRSAIIAHANSQTRNKTPLQGWVVDDSLTLEALLLPFSEQPVR